MGHGVKKKLGDDEWPDQAPGPHRFGFFKLRGIRVVGWSMPQNKDDDVIYAELGRDPDKEPPFPPFPVMK
jgi:hypothetical protein